MTTAAFTISEENETVAQRSYVPPLAWFIQFLLRPTVHELPRLWHEYDRSSVTVVPHYGWARPSPWTRDCIM